ncbi:MAG: sensor domain-containing diguanylate cyclase, partial [Myxococcota bacterium]|nr:sensor domain-containing diguanylate cyclase [Myxococcota bacterium]
MSAPWLAMAPLVALLLAGVFHIPPESLSIEHALVALAWLGLLAVRLAAWLAPWRVAVQRSGAPLRTQLEVGVLGWVGAQGLVAVGGGMTGPCLPLLYALLATYGAFARRLATAALVLVAGALDAVLWFVTEGHSDPWGWLRHFAFVAGFASIGALAAGVEVVRVRARTRRERDEERRRLHEQARMFRLVAAPAAGGSHDEERLVRSSVEEVRQQLYETLALVRHALGLHGCVLLLRDGSGERLQLVEAVTDVDELVDRPLGEGEGVLGAVVGRGQSTMLAPLRPDFTGIPYYRERPALGAFLGVPVREGERVIGALCADRREPVPFATHEQQVLERLAAQIVRIIHNERLFAQLERTKHEQQVLHRASAALGAALSEEQVFDAALAAAADVAPHDLAVLASYDARARTHRVRRAVGDGAERFAGLVFRDNASLVAMAVRTRHHLPYRGEHDPRQHVVFTRRTPLDAMRSVLVLPLVARDDVIGTLTLATRRAGAFGDSVRSTLAALSSQLAVSLSNAAAVRRLEELATTDGLTGCLNKRAFLEELDKRLRAAQRFGHPLSLIVTDIDHFKSVNDTYGHATGDAVLRELGTILRRLKRDTDVVARFGGEEFCVLCEQTPARGAVQLAERVRTELESTVFQTEMGPLRVTCSLGVSTLGADAVTAAGLFEAADRALYAAKRSGRNRTCTASTAAAA